MLRKTRTINVVIPGGGEPRKQSSVYLSAAPKDKRIRPHPNTVKSRRGLNEKL
jgi:hypothetical protein